MYEILLLVANAATLFLAFWKRSKKFWIGAVGLNIALLLLHGLIEGFRYQMFFSYLFVVCVVVLAAVIVSGKLIDVKMPRMARRIGKIAGLGLASMLLVGSALMAQAFPVFHLQKPTGTEAVGVSYLHLVDEKRADPFLSTGARRELMVKVYYPAKPDASKPFASYFNSSTELTKAYAEFYGLPSFGFSHFSHIKTQAKNDLVVSDAQGKYPVVLFSHGAGTSVEVSTEQSQDLASHGYIVIAIDHPYVSAATAFPDHLVTARQATTNFDVLDPAEPITKIMADDASFVIEELDDLQQGKITPAFKNKLDLDAVGVIGHSVGGAVAYDMALKDERVKAAINLDGKVYVGNESHKSAPLLMLASNKDGVLHDRQSFVNQLTIDPGTIGNDQASTAQREKMQRYMNELAYTLKASGGLYVIEGSDHMKLTDIGLYIANPVIRNLLQIGGSTDSARCLEITSALTSSFFDHHLKGKTTNAADIMQKYPELKAVNLN